MKNEIAISSLKIEDFKIDDNSLDDTCLGKGSFAKVYKTFHK